MKTVKNLTKKQKIKLLMGADFWTNYDADGQIYKFVVSDGPIGLRQISGVSLFPDAFADMGYRSCV